MNKNKSDSSENRLLSWEMNGSVRPVYEIKPTPKIDDSRVVFSPDGKYFALDVGKNLQIYDTETGKLKVELSDFELPSWGWMDNDTIINIDTKRAKNPFEEDHILEAFDASNGRLLYRQKLTKDIVLWPSRFDPYQSDDDSVSEVGFIEPHPTRKMFATVSAKFVKIFDSHSGELLQTLTPTLPAGSDRTKIRGQLAEGADWSKDGKALYIFGGNGQSVSIWKLIE